MSPQRIVAFLLALSVVGFAQGPYAQTSKPQKVKERPRASGRTAGPATITGNWANGYFCVEPLAASVHLLGWMPAFTSFMIEFDSTDTSDPIAQLASVQFANGGTGGETMSSDDDGGALNPFFSVRKPYAANWVLSVGSADDDPACYSYKLTVR